MAGLTAQQQLGDLAARGLDALDEGDGLVSAVLIIADRVPGDPSLTRTFWLVPDDQPWVTTVGLVDDWRLTQIAELTCSRMNLNADDDDDEDGDDD